MKKTITENLKKATDLYSELEIHFDWIIKDKGWNCTLGDGFYHTTENKYFILCAFGKTMDKALELALNKLLETTKAKVKFNCQDIR